MLAWLRRKAREEQATPTVVADPGPPHGHGMSKAFLALHRHLKGRYADVVVLTFRDLEALLDGPLPALARLDPKWWTSDDAANFEHSNSWRLASRTAVPNLAAQTITFARA